MEGRKETGIEVGRGGGRRNDLKKRKRGWRQQGMEQDGMEGRKRREVWRQQGSEEMEWRGEKDRGKGGGRRRGKELG